MKIMHRQESRPRPVGAVSIGVLFLVTFLLLALGAVGIFYTYKHNLSREARIQQGLQAAQMAATNAIAERIKAEQDIQRAVAQNRQSEVLADSRNATNQLYLLLAETRAFEAKRTAILGGEVGARIARFPDLVLAARRLIDETRTIPTPSAIQQRLEATRRVEYEVRQNLGTAYDPSAVRAGLEEDLRWANRWIEDVKSKANALESLKADAETKLPPPESDQLPQTLQQAIDAQVAAETRARQELFSRSKDEAQKVGDERVAIAVYEKALAERDTEATRLRTEIEALKAEMARQLAEQQAAIKRADTETQVTIKKTEAETEAIRLRAKAQEPDVVEALRPFTTPGYWNPGGKLTPDLKPMSLNAIRAVGALNRSEKGILKLQDVATTNMDKIRPRMDRDRIRLNQQRYGEYSELQALLIELGSTLVELKMLEP